MKEPTISLIIPAYNEEKYIGSCLDYVFKNAQGKFLEIIVVNNASTDSTSEIAMSYPDVRVVNESSKGLTRARQRGFLEAKGDILAYIDADTQIPEGWHEKIVSEFGKNKNLACLSGPAYYYDISKWRHQIVKFFYWYFLAMPAYFITGYMVMGANFAIKKSIVEKMGGFDTSIEFYGEDTNTAKRAHKFGKVKFTPSFFLYTSGRRLKGQGIYKSGLIYLVNYLSEAFAGKQIVANYKDFR